MADKKTAKEDYNWIAHKGSIEWTPPKKKTTKRKSNKKR